MKWVLRTGAGVLLLIAALVLVAGAYWLVWSQWGWGAMPDKTAPARSVVYDSDFEPVNAEALTLLATMRETYRIPGATAAVSLDGKLVWAGAVGWSDLDAATPMSVDTIMRIGSTSKAMTSTVLARLDDAGTLSISDTVADHAQAPNPEWGSRRLDQLMSHTAGFPGYDDNTDFPDNIDTLRMAGSYASVEEGLDLFDGSQMLHGPGETYSYSSFDVNVAAWTAVKATGSSYPDLLRQQIREPLGLDTPLPGDFGAPHPAQSKFYQIRDGGQVRDWPHTDVSQRWPGGGLVSRSRDLVLIGGAWLGGEFITTGTRERFWTPVLLNDGSVNSENYAIGWRVGTSTTRFGDEHPVRVAHHGGVSRGAMSWLIIYPDLGLVVAVNINTNTPQFGDFSSVEPELTRLFARHAGRAPDQAVPGGT